MAFKIEHEVLGGEMGSVLASDASETGLALAALASKLMEMPEAERNQFITDARYMFRDWWRNDEKSQECARMIRKLLPRKPK